MHFQCFLQTLRWCNTRRAPTSKFLDSRASNSLPFIFSGHNPADENEAFTHTTRHALHANVFAVAGAIFWFAVHDGRLIAR
jgi:hypothetical protein